MSDPDLDPEFILVGGHAATFDSDDGAIGALADAAIAVAGGRILWVGRETALPKAWAGATRVRLDGRWVTPGLIDPWTRLIWAGPALGGAGPDADGADLARAMRAADEEALMDAALPRLARLIADGVTTLAIGTGDAPDAEVIRRVLRVARAIGAVYPLRVVTLAEPAGVLAADPAIGAELAALHLVDRQHGRPAGLALAADWRAGPPPAAPLVLATGCRAATPVLSALTVLHLAVARWGIAPEAALAAMTVTAAGALGLDSKCGRIRVGLDADLAVWEVAHPAELTRWLGAPLCVGSLQAGRWAVPLRRRPPA